MPEILDDYRQLIQAIWRSRRRERYAASIERVEVQEPPDDEPAAADTPEDQDAAEAALDRAASQTDTDPSDEQKAAGNYRKGRCTLWGLPITLENPRGSVRRGVTREGDPWETTMPHHYGYIRRTESEADGDHIDVFIGPDLESELVFVVDQLQPATGRFDEHKVMLGFRSAAEARQAYEDAYQAGWKGLESITPMTLPAFKAWLERGDTGSRLAKQVAKYGKKDAAGHLHDDQGRFARASGRVEGFFATNYSHLGTPEGLAEAHAQHGAALDGHYEDAVQDYAQHHVDTAAQALAEKTGHAFHPAFEDSTQYRQVVSRVQEEAGPWSEADYRDDAGQFDHANAHEDWRLGFQNMAEYDPRRALAEAYQGFLKRLHREHIRGEAFARLGGETEQYGKYQIGQTKTVSGRVYRFNENSRWERVRQKADPKSAIVITGNEFGVNWTDKTARAQLLPQLVQQYQGKSFSNVETGRPIMVGRRGIKKVFSHLPDPKPAMALAKLPEILQDAVWTHSAAPTVPDRNTKVWHYFETDVVLQGNSHVAEIKIREDPNGAWFYDWHLKILKKEEEDSPYKPGTPEAGGTSAGESSTGEIIDPDAPPVKKNSRDTGESPERYTLVEVLAREFYARGFTRLRYRQAHPEPKGGWVTLGGARAHVDADGVIDRGCAGLKGEHVEHLGQGESHEHRELRQHRQDVAEHHGLEGHQLTRAQVRQLETMPHPETGEVPRKPSPKAESRPTGEQPSPVRVSLGGRDYDAKQQHGFWFTQPTGHPEAGWTMAGKGTIEEIQRQSQAASASQQSEVEKAVAKGRRKTAGQEARKASRTQRMQDVVRTAEDHGLAPDELLAALEWVKQDAQEKWTLREPARQHARQLTGLTQRDTARLANQGFDYTSAKRVKGATGERLAHWDEFAQEVAREHPELGWGDPDNPRVDLGAALWDLIDEGAQKAPTAQTPEMLRDAANLALAARNDAGGAWQHEEGAPVGAGDEDLPDWLKEDFERRRDMVLRYCHYHRSCIAGHALKELLQAEWSKRTQTSPIQGVSDVKRQYPPTHPMEVERYEKDHEEREQAAGKKLKDDWEEDEELEIDGSEGPNAGDIANDLVLTADEIQTMEDLASGISKIDAPSRKKYAAEELPSEAAGVSPEKARKILEDGEVNGYPLTEAQRRMFGAIAGGKS